MTTRYGWFWQAVLAAVLTFAALFLGIAVLATSMAIVQSTALETDHRAQLRFTPDGQPCVLSNQSDRGSWLSRGFMSTTYTDLDGKPIEAPKVDETGADLNPTITLDGLQNYIPAYHITGENRVAEYWYLVHERGGDQAYLVGYSAVLRSRIGFIGTAGFSVDKPPRDQWFAVRDFGAMWMKNAPGSGVVVTEGDVSTVYDSGDYDLVLDCTAVVYSVDLRNHTLRTIFADPDRPVGAVAATDTARLLVLTNQTIERISHDGGRETFPLPSELRDRDLTVATNSGAELTVAVHGRRQFGSSEEPVAIYTLGTDGPTGSVRHAELHDPDEVRIETGVPLMLGSPALQLFTLGANDRDQWRHYRGMDDQRQYVRAVMWRDCWWLAATAAIGAVLAALCYRRQARFRLSRGQRIFWPLYVFLLGLPGWIGYRYSRRWPELEACPACRQPVPRRGETCASCHHDFPLPAVKGTEIFA